MIFLLPGCSCVGVTAQAAVVVAAEADDEFLRLPNTADMVCRLPTHKPGVPWGTKKHGGEDTHTLAAE